MKTAAFLFALLTVLLTVEPLVLRAANEREEMAATSCCRKTKKCHPQKEKQEPCERDCGARTCNAFAGYAACAYLPAEKPSYKYLALAAENKFTLRYTEHVAQGFTSECWQPPELFFV